MKNLKNKVEELIDNSEYDQASELVAKELGIELHVLDKNYTSMSWDKKGEARWVFDLRLSRGGKDYDFEFGQSIANGDTDPTMYDVLSCLTKYDPETFEDFCASYGYDEDSRSAYSTYEKVQEEYDTISDMFTEDELEILNEIS